MNIRSFFYNLPINIFFVFTLIISCSSGSEESDGGGGPVDPPSEIIPTNLSVNITIEGSDSANPNGDGSGLVKFSASATNAVSYSYRFGTGDSKTSTGPVEFTYSDIGTKTYNVKVIALGDSQNDLPLLEYADISIVIPGKHGPNKYLTSGISSGEFILANAPHAYGWADSVNSIIKKYFKT